MNSRPPKHLNRQADAVAPNGQESYARHVNPEWAKLANLLQMNLHYTRCTGAELETAEGRTILDFLSGYCVHNTGHNHPYIVQQLIDELQAEGPAMLQSNIVESAGTLAEALCKRAGGKVSKAFFCSSGSEGIEAVIKFSRAFTKRTEIVYATGAFHGLTCGALSLMGDQFWREGFGPMLSGTTEVPFGDLAAIEKAIATRKVAAVVLEPIQGEAGIVVPPPDYLKGVERLCQSHGTLFVLDEVQTGMGRTGKFLAAHHYGVEPDMIVMAKALSGGLVPCAAVLMTDEICNSVYHSLRRAFIHTSTFSENTLAMRAALATLDVLANERLAERAQSIGLELRENLRRALASFEMVKEIRGEGLLCGIEFQAPHTLALRLPFEAFKAINPAMFGQMIVMRMFNDKNILTQICGNNFMVLKVAPPLIISERQIDYFIKSINDVVAMMHSSGTFWSDAIKLGRCAVST
ncbi:MAG: aspartate aminotransferase family protein [Acidobacteriales bacterium 59-55]|nr:aspartate aminotransferase family protein [Terriglobales bacterium]OJV39520.1 MAG: aspartate aminotransferase family protein [Acidobacteriales bacterium 59-55]